MGPSPKPRAAWTISWARASMGIYYPQLLDPSIALAGEFGVSAIPHLFLFDPDGKIVQQGMRGEGIDALLRTVFK